MKSPKSRSFLNSCYGNLSRQLRNAGGEQQLLIPPDDAGERQIEDGQTVRINNARGAFEAAASLSDAVMPGVVVSPFGFWCQGSAGDATVQAVNSPALADLGAAPTFPDVLVEVEATT